MFAVDVENRNLAGFVGQNPEGLAANSTEGVPWLDAGTFPESALAGWHGKKRALVAVGHSLLVTGYYMITRQLDYQDLGANYLDERNKEAVKRRAIQRLERLGYLVELRPVVMANAA